ncbi:retron system putative HNH endonuclease [Cereibacter johrii]|uniref:retron system putative HNH endonuclease n=1 Tax=Cereibacter johrii TaxID=445629 RepID=UPI002B1EB97D|nr:retron system putative HNH endonuclease [Cereibacter johrii]MEA5163528.1 retron system putative HNH endonuclease [Cereibacter johrii]
MRRISKSPRAPKDYEEFAAANPNANWAAISENKELQAIKERLKDALYADQLGLCAYCESKLHLARGTAVDDFRVEHFHPKSDETGDVNWNLAWGNLLAVCTGGNQRALADPSKFTKPDFSCDVPKGDKILDGIILDPSRDIPAGEKIFYFRSDGRMAVHERCPDALRDMALATIRELRLSETEGVSPPAKRLDTLRRDIISRVSDAISEEIEQVTHLTPGLDDEEVFSIALTTVADKIIPDPNDPPSFYSAVSQFLGK